MDKTYIATSQSERKPSCANQRAYRLPLYVCVAALLLTFWPNAAHAQEPLSWPDHSPYARIDDPEEPVLMPKDAAWVAQQRLKDKSPEHWGMTIHTFRSMGRNFRVVELFVDGARADANFLVVRHSWNLLNDRNIICLDEVLNDFGRELVESSFDRTKQQNYLGWLDFLVLGMSMPLDDEFIRQHFAGDNQRAHWLENQEKSADALLRYCHNVFAEWQDKQVTFTYNCVLRNGSVVQRTVHARVVGKRLELLRVETVELRPEGTFSYPDLI